MAAYRDDLARRVTNRLCCRAQAGKCVRPLWKGHGPFPAGPRRGAKFAPFHKGKWDQAAVPPTVRPSSSNVGRSEEHTSELQSLMRISYAVFCLKKKNTKQPTSSNHIHPTQSHNIITGVDHRSTR